MDGAEQREDGARREEGEEGQEGETCSEEHPERPPSTREPVSGVLCCEDCGETFMEESAYLEHRSQHQKETLYSDDQLDGSHSAEKDCGTSHLCTLCSLSFDNLSEFHLHMENHAQVSQEQWGVQSKQPVYECLNCGKSYGVLGHLLNHQRSHRPPSKSVFHDLEHLKKKSFQCEFCGRNYSRASALDAHRRYHEEKLVKSKSKSSGDVAQTGEPVVETKQSENQADDYSEKTFKCGCGKAFPALTRLKTHQRFSRNRQCSPEDMRQKTKKSRYYCTNCDKTFSSHIALFNHQRWHANRSDAPAQRFPCEECGKEFMTLTFYYKHQRLAHSTHETPAKSFLHQVCQLQKKAFECKDCGLKFSRASALNSHQLHHSDAFSEAEKDGQVNSSVSPQQKVSDKKQPESNKIEHLQPSPEETVQSDFFLPDDTAEASHISENEDDMDSYEPGDFNIQVISASESEDEPLPHPNPDLELVCESDQDLKDEVKEGSIECEDCGLTFEQWEDYQTHLHQHALEEEEAIAEEDEVHEADDEENMDGERSTTTSMDMDHRTVYSCPTCGKIYSYLSSFEKHLRLHDDKPPEPAPRSVMFSKMPKYECPECGLSFIRRTRLLSHLRVHNQDEIPVPRCDQCNKSFTSEKSWMAHTELHIQKPFWCLSCALGFRNEDSLDKHLQNHGLTQRKQSSDPKSVPAYPRKTDRKLNVCTYCGKSFCYPGSLISHQRKHLRGFARSRVLREKTPRQEAMLAGCDTKTLLRTVKEEPERKERSESEENVLKDEGENPQEKFRDHEKVADSDCGQQLHPSERSGPSVSPGHQSGEESKPDTAESQTSMEMDEGASLEEERAHKYWEWECFDCDMGFDEVAELHLHYIKHATGEVPMLNDGMEG